MDNYAVSRAMMNIRNLVHNRNICLFDGKCKELVDHYHGKKNKYCIKHLDSGKNKCLSPNCKTRAQFSFPNQSPKYCRIHRLNGMISYRSKTLCSKPGCPEPAELITTVHKTTKLCVKHRNEIVMQTCNWPSCFNIYQCTTNSHIDKHYCQLHRKYFTLLLMKRR